MTKSRKAKKVQYIAYSDESDDSCAEPVETQPVEVEPEAEVEEPVKKTRKPRKSRRKKVVEEEGEGGGEVDLTASMSSVKLDDKPVKVKKPKRKASKYNEYISLMMKNEAIKKLPPKQRFSAIAKSWKAEKAKSAK